MLKLHADRLRERSVRRLEDARDTGYTYGGLYCDPIIMLGLLKDPRALPVLEKVSGFKAPLLRHLAKKAIADIRGKL